MKKPNIINKAWNLSNSIIQYAKSGFDNTSKEKYKERLTLCNSCELLNKEKGTCQKNK